jgi:transposase
MAQTIHIVLLETTESLQLILGQIPSYKKARIKMLLRIATGLSSSKSLSAKLGVSANTIAIWKRSYHQSGLSGLLADDRGGDYRSGIDTATKQKIKAKLADPKDSLTSYKQAQQWISEELNIDKQYHAVYQYLRRNFDTKLKVGRKSHVKKDESAVAVFKNAPKDSDIYKKQQFQ